MNAKIGGVEEIVIINFAFNIENGMKRKCVTPKISSRTLCYTMHFCFIFGNLYHKNNLKFISLYFLCFGSNWWRRFQTIHTQSKQSFFFRTHFRAFPKCVFGTKLKTDFVSYFATSKRHECWATYNRILRKIRVFFLFYSHVYFNAFFSFIFSSVFRWYTHWKALNDFFSE